MSRSSSRVRKAVSYVEPDDGSDVAGKRSDDEDDFVNSKKRSSFVDDKPDEDEDNDEDAGSDDAPKPVKRRASRAASTLPPGPEREKELIESAKWRISSGERTRSSSGQLLLNPTITTVRIEPVTDDDAKRTKLVSFNVNGLRAFLKKASFKKYMDEEKPDIIAMQETKTNDKTGKGAVDLSGHIGEGYHAYWSHARTPGYSGNLVLSRWPALSVLNTMPVVSTHAEGDSDTDGRVLALEFERCWVVSLYVPNSAEKLVNLPYRRDWNKALVAFVKGLSKPAFLMGDLNVAHNEIDLHNPKGNKRSAGFTQEERDDFQVLLDSGYVDCWRRENPGVRDVYTYWGYRHNARETNKGWRVDYVLAHNDLVSHVEKSFIRKEVLGSDHCPHGIVINTSLFAAKQ